MILFRICLVKPKVDFFIKTYRNCSAIRCIHVILNEGEDVGAWEVKHSLYSFKQYNVTIQESRSNCKHWGDSCIVTFKK